MNCPKCNSENIVQIGPLMRCQSCEHYFNPLPAEPAGAVKMEPCPKCGSENVFETEPGILRCECGTNFFGRPKLPVAAVPPISALDRIRRSALVFESFAILVAAAGIIALIVFGFSFRTGDSGDVSWTSFYFFLTCECAALWLYLVAQIIHIRANTEK